MIFLYFVNFKKLKMDVFIVLQENSSKSLLYTMNFSMRTDVCIFIIYYILASTEHLEYGYFRKYD